MTDPAAARLAAMTREEKARLFELLRAKKERTAPAAAARIPRRDREADPPPLSFAQQRLWFLDRLAPGDPTYHVPGGFFWPAELAPDLLGRAAEALALRHEVLRTTFAERGGQPVQLIAAGIRVAVPEIDLSALPWPARRAELPRCGGTLALLPFDLATGPLLRLALVRTVAGESAVVFSLHHIIGDGWSLPLFVREIAALYRGLSTGDPAPLPELTVQYADFACWQRAWLSGEVLEAQLGVWRRRLAAAPEPLPLPYDHRRPAGRVAAGGVVPMVVPERAAAGARALAREGSATLFMVLLAAWGALLARLSGQADVVVGSAVANRNRAEVAPLIGFFVNTLALRLDLTADPTFAQAVAQAREVALEAYANQDLPFEKILDELHLDRSAARSPLFDTLLVLQNTGGGNAPVDPMSLRSLPVATGTAKFDLTLGVGEAKRGSLVGYVEYAAARFFRTTAWRISRAFATLLAAGAADPRLRLSELPLLAEGERFQLLHGWNDTASPYPREATLADRVALQAARTPEAPAVSFGGETLSYRDLLRQAAAVAGRLAAFGVGPETPVAVVAERSAWLIAALLGIVEAGGAYLALDPAWPAERLAFLLADAGVSVLVGEERAIAALPGELALPPLVVTADGPGPAPALAPGKRALPGSLACLMYTSGTTGEPKGVAVTHANITRLVAGLDAYAPLGPGDTVLQLAPLSFDASTFEIWGALGRGARLLVAPPAAPSLDELTDLLARERVTALWLTAGLFHSLVEHRPEGLGGLRFLLAGGDVLSPVHAARAAGLLRRGRLIDGYGPTEGTTFTCCEVVGAPAAAGEPVPIGRPIPNARAYAVDARLRPVPIGVVGELLAGGDGLARGYWSRPDTTALRFVPDPFGEPGGRLYRTGDQVRFLPDGRLEFVGRRDGQVKIRGFRVELGEVEAALAAHPGVAEVAVLALAEETAAGAAPLATAGGGDRRLAAFVVARPGALPAAPRELAAGLQAYLRERLPEPFIPGSCVAVDALPLTANGKLDRRALAQLAARQDPGEPEAAARVPPRTPVERAMAELWVEVLGLPPERLGVEDSFFDLGGHSLLATRLVSRIRDRFEVELPLAALFEEPTLGGLCGRLSAATAREDGGEIPALGPAADGAPLSASQERLWFLNRLEPRSAAYNMPLLVRLAGALDRAALAATFAAIVERHGALRTTFHALPAGPVQRVAAPAAPGAFALSLADLSALPAAAREGELGRLAREDAARPFDLSRGPLFRPLLLALAEPAEHAVFATMHHIVSDGWSLDLFVDELLALYGAARAGEPSPLAPLPIQYTDFAAWQRRREASGEWEPQLAYWRERLAGAPPALELPAERPRPPLQTFAGKGLGAWLEPELAGRLRHFAHGAGATQFMVLLAAFGAVFARATGQLDLVLGAPIAGRTRRETEGLIGFFLNSLALRFDLSGAPTFRDLVGRVREATLGAYAHQEIPIERLLEEVKPERDLSRPPLFQVVINWLAFGAAHREPAHLPGLALSPLGWGDPLAKFDLEVYAGESGGGITLSLVYNRDLFAARQMEELVGQLRAVLAAALESPERRLPELPLAAAAGLESAGAPAAASAPGALGEAFRAVAARHAGRRAVVMPGGEAVTYGELAHGADRIACALAAHLAEPSRVALHLGGGAARAAAMLGALIAGHAYVPLDPSYPEERRRAIVADAGAALCLIAAGEGSPPTALLDGLPVLALEDLPDLPPGWRPPAVPAEALAYLLYTSGSTGEPKGVMQSHAGVLGHIGTYVERLGLQAEDRLTLLPSYGFDAAVMDLFGALLAGAELHPWDVRSEGMAGLGAFLRERRITVYHSTPTVLRAFLSTLAGDETFPDLRLVVLGGEEVVDTDLERLAALVPGCRVINGLGPTESTLALQHLAMPGAAPDEAPARRGVPVGRPVAGMAVALETAAGGQEALWGVGEILLAGPHLARGYWRRGDLTADAFRPDPRGDGGRRYHTGDLGRLLPGGLLEFAGRGDAQVKVRGMRVEPGEIEAALARLPGVAEAAVKVIRRAGDVGLAAYVVPEAGAALVPEALREALRRRLPAPMIPASFTLLERLPVTPTGKVDRHALPDPPAPAADALEALPASDLERRVAAVWQAVLGRERVGVEKSFFDLGGHSLLLLALHARLQEALGRELALVDLFTYPTVRSFATHLQADPGESAAVEQARSRAQLQIDAARRQRELAAARLQRR